MDQRLKRYKKGRHANVDTSFNLGLIGLAVLVVVALGIALIVAANVNSAGKVRTAAEAAGLTRTEEVSLQPAIEDEKAQNPADAQASLEQNPADPAEPKELPVPPGQVKRLEIEDSAGEKREYLLSVPQGYDPTNPEPLPLTFILHGKGGSPMTFIEGSLFKTDIVDESLIVLPEGKNAAWGGAPYSDTTIDQDVNLVLSLLETMARDYNVDRSRVYAAGFSNGGGMVANLACREPGRFAGMATVSGAFYTPIFDDCDNRGIPFMTVHGTDDGTIPYKGGEKWNTELISVLDATNNYARRNGCSFVSANLDQLPLNQVAVFEGCIFETQHLRIPGGHHVWPKDVPTAEKIWDFLRRQHR